MGLRRQIVVWTLIVAVGGFATYHARRIEAAFAGDRVNAPQQSIADLVKRARVGSTSLGPNTQTALSLAEAARRPPRVARLRRSGAAGRRQIPGRLDQSARRRRQALREAMQQRPAMKTPTAATALAALTAATGSIAAARGGMPTAYGELAPNLFADRRLTILQIGDSHTAGGFLLWPRARQVAGSVRRRSGDAFVVPGKRMSACARPCSVPTPRTTGPMRRCKNPTTTKRFHLSGFNALTHHASGALTMRSRNGRAYDYADVSFLAQPGGGAPRCCSTGRRQAK